jgi:hypothetical protein
MRARIERRSGQPALELIEESVHLLRRAPALSLAVYYTGALPFVLGFMYYWSDMSNSAFAHQRCAEGALAVTVLYLWMKCWQAGFAAQLRAQLARQPAPAWSARRVWRLVATQTIVQPTGLLLLPVALVAALPFGWVYAFYQNLTVTGDGQTGTLADAVGRAARQARLWPAQNHVVIAAMCLFACFVFLNLLAALALAPELARMFFGIETVFTLSGLHLVNSTYLVVVLGATYLCVNPLLKTIYAVRCFYGESLQTGADLRADLRVELTSYSRGRAVVAALILLIGWPAPPALAAGNGNGGGSAEAQVAAGPAPAEELDRLISEVLQQRRYAWRLPREPEEGQKGLVASLLEGVVGWLRRVFETVERWIERFGDWLRKLFPSRVPTTDQQPRGWLDWVRSLTGIVAVLALGVAFFLWRAWRRGRRRPVEAIPLASVPLPDLADENIGADQLPEDGWLAQARELLQRGELRLALRAMYLASLAHLAARELIGIARYKSNHDYQRELERRARSRVALREAFAENVSLFERAWYGMHETSEESLERFMSNLERIRAGAV